MNTTALGKLGILLLLVLFSHDVFVAPDSGTASLGVPGYERAVSVGQPDSRAGFDTNQGPPTHREMSCSASALAVTMQGGEYAHEAVPSSCGDHHFLQAPAAEPYSSPEPGHPRNTGRAFLQVYRI